MNENVVQTPDLIRYNIITVRERNNLTTSVTLLDELPSTHGVISYAVAHCQACFDLQGNGFCFQGNGVCLASIALQIKTSLTIGNGIGYHIPCQ